MSSDHPALPVPVAYTALAQSVRLLAEAPVTDRGWRLRRLIADAARLAAADGEEPLSLAQDAWHAALGAAPVARAPAMHVVRSASRPTATILPFRAPAHR